jgi:hypothetical protein
VRRQGALQGVAHGRLLLRAGEDDVAAGDVGLDAVEALVRTEAGEIGHHELDAADVDAAEQGGVGDGCGHEPAV